MEAIGLILGLLITVGICALVCLLTALFAQWAMKIVVKRMPQYGKAYAIVFKITLIGMAINVLLGQLVQLSDSLVYVTAPLSFLIWLLLYSYLFGIWFTRNHHPIGFVKGLLVNLIVSGLSFVLGLVVIVPLFLFYYSNGMAMPVQP